MKIVSKIKAAIAAWQFKREWSVERQLERARVILREDHQWMAHDPKVAAVCQRHRDLLAIDWMNVPMPHVSDFRQQIGCDPHKKPLPRDELLRQALDALAPFRKDAEGIHVDWSGDRTRASLTQDRPLLVSDFRKAMTAHQAIAYQLAGPQQDLVSADPVATAARRLQEQCFGAASAAGWWHDVKTGEPITANPYCFSNKLMLTVSEISEAMEGDRKNLPDDKLPHRPMREVELADAVIRIFDLAGGFGLDLPGAISEKLVFNAQRPDHKIAHRQAAGGKQY